MPDPVDNLDRVEGDWKLLFSTISIKACGLWCLESQHGVTGITANQVGTA